ncbi:hypothetical protein NDU88_004111 [Pleurodeles waltl]|uniref:Uncharacterized protein n=1 Tax=Pleurodeles waltl TaxID=8319 RepID=A0AAV7W419_PLEWA|nr:hypothetical protein NDU88_004111 [Pleurodeles waltl]
MRNHMLRRHDPKNDVSVGMDAAEKSDACAAKVMLSYFAGCKPTLTFRNSPLRHNGVCHASKIPLKVTNRLKNISYTSKGSDPYGSRGQQ